MKVKVCIPARHEVSVQTALNNNLQQGTSDEEFSVAI